MLGLPGCVTLFVFRSRLPWDAVQYLVLAGCWLLCASVMWRGASSARPVVTFGLLVVVACGLHLAAFNFQKVYLDNYRDDRDFLESVLKDVPAGKSILINGEDGALCTSWWLHYGQGRIRMLHNLSFLCDERLDPHEVYLIARRDFEPLLAKYGTTELLLESRLSKCGQDPGKRYTLFRLRYHRGLVRRSADVHISPLQATRRIPGPFLD